ncbi:hypothetical protein B7L70_10315 [Vulcanisaeta sp. EB80]|uniref:hypothetical protein n=1 Tax=Vulcanisaeta sp. EB80 TaxID=1650660 RepID=UPI0009BF0ADE|nr:hypothetical protein [Vulcanisaeta sp. EB80]PLC65644.1 hypothetical protein B7L70_10315 [Vulcanisaeta sp. EB80]
MGRVIMMVVSSTWLAYAVSAILTGILVIAVFTIQEASLLIMIAAVLASIAIAAAFIIILPRTVVATFTVDELLVSGKRGGFSLPRDAVVNNNVVCIMRTRWVLKLRVTHGSIDYTIPLSKWQYNRLVNKLREHWGWVPPECWW